MMRNAALGLPLPFDYDLAIEGDVKTFSEKLAGVLGGNFFLLDEESNTWRVVKKGAYTPYTIDTAPLKGGDILTDLARRDFTVNSLAVSVEELFCTAEPVIVDPLAGMKDLKAKLLRIVYDQAFDDDPLRILRAVRVSQQCALKITEETEAIIEKKAPLLAETARERIGDELLMIFSYPGTAWGVAELFDLGIVKTVLPELCGWEDVDGYNLLDHTLKTLAEAEALVTGPSFAESKEHFAGYVGNVRRSAFLKLGAFFHDVGKPAAMRRDGDVFSFIGHDIEGEELTKKILKRLRVGRKVTGEVAKLVRNHHRVFTLASLKEPSMRSRIHFFNAVGGEAGLDLLFLALADARATRGGEDEELRSLVEQMLSFYYDVYRKKEQKPILGGKEIMETFGIPEGVLVGEIMRKVSEAVETGVVRSKKGAVRYIRQWLPGKVGNKGRG
jgi:putative nucleotidyltransferase with HDIG domain